VADRTPDDELIFDLGMALKRMPIEVCRQLGARVLDHLTLCRWQFTRPPIAEAHGSALPSNETERTDDG
jgi:hypothetical protein